MEALARTLHIGKHASFHADVTVHELTNVPLVTGKFACKWRFKNAMSAQAALQLAADGPTLPTGGGLLHPRSALHISRKAKPDSDDDDERDHDHDDGSSDGSSAGSRRRASMASGGVAAAMMEPVGRTMSSSTARPSPAVLAAGRKVESSGVTEPVPLAKHTAAWSDRRVFCPVSASVGRDGELGYCILKLVVRQTFHNDIGKQEDARLGHVHLDLSEFTDPSRPSTRRFLLDSSKINALLRVTVKMTHVGGCRDWRPPPRDRKSQEMSNKKSAASRSSLGSKRGKHAKDRSSPSSSSMHSKRSGGSSSPRHSRHNGDEHSNRSSEHQANGHSHHHHHHDGDGHHHEHISSPEALIEHLFSVPLADMPGRPPPPRPARSPPSATTSHTSSGHRHSPDAHRHVTEPARTPPAR